MLIYLKPLRSKNIYYSFFAFVLSLIFALPVMSQNIETDIQEIMKSAGIPGIQISYSDGQTVKHIAQGVKKYGEPAAILCDTRFQAASLTKVITAYTFFRLLDQGLITLDRPLLEYYPYDRLAHTKAAEKITARMVLTHRTGLLNWEGDVPTDAWRKSPLTLQFEPGSDYMYSGEGFYFLQETLEHITGQSFQQLVEEQVLKPLAMSKSNIVWNDSLIANAAYGHYELSKPRRLGTYRNSNAAYTLYTTSADYLTFIQKALLNGEGLKESTHQQMMTRSAEAKKGPAGSPEDKYVPCALGLRMQINEIGTAYWHTGSNPGFRCFFITYPASKETITVFMNSDTAFPAMKKLMQLLLSPNQTFWAYDWRQGELD